MNKQEQKILLAVKITFILIPCFILLWLINKNFALTGMVKYTYSPGKYRANQVVTLDSPDLIKGIYQSDGKIHWFASGDNLKFTARVLRNFDTVKVKLNLNNINNSDINLYAQGGVEKGEYHDMVLNQFLDELAWPKINDINLNLWQRPNGFNEEKDEMHREVRQYQSIDEFLSDPPEADKIGVFGLAAEQFYKFPDYENNQSERSINHYFRGRHTLYFYKEDEPFRLSFKKIDLNRQTDKDELVLKIYLGSELIYVKSIGDDGDLLGSNKAGQTQEMVLDLPDFKRGFYRLEIEASEDVIFGDMATNLKYLYFSGHVFFADGPAYLSDNQFEKEIMQTDSKSLSFETAHSLGVNQIITLGRNQQTQYRRINIKNKKEIYTLADIKGDNFITVPKTDIYVVGGNFAFPNFDLPTVVMPITADSVAQKISDIDYIIASYSPKETSGPVTFTKEYDLKNLMLKNNKIYFNVYSPGLYANKGQLEIKQIEVTFSGQALTPAKFWEKAKLFLNNILKKS